MAPKATANYTKTTEQLDLERRLAAEKGEPLESDTGVERSFVVPDNEQTDGYFGVSPEYATYANDAEAPFFADGGVQKDVEDKALAAIESAPSEDATKTPDGDVVEVPDDNPPGEPVQP
jgi:hypothetical protein